MVRREAISPSPGSFFLMGRPVERWGFGEEGRGDGIGMA
jgi:hypothetical protein